MARTPDEQRYLNANDEFTRAILTGGGRWVPDERDPDRTLWIHKSIRESGGRTPTAFGVQRDPRRGGWRVTVPSFVAGRSIQGVGESAVAAIEDHARKIRLALGLPEVPSHEYKAPRGSAPASALDAATEKHLDAWLQRQFNEDDRPEHKAAMIKVYAEDPERWADRGWTAVLDETRNRPSTIPTATKPGIVTAIDREGREYRSLDDYNERKIREEEAHRVPPGKARCSVCGKVGSKAHLAKHEAKCKSGKCGHVQGSLFGNQTPAEKDMAKRIADERGDE